MNHARTISKRNTRMRAQTTTTARLIAWLASRSAITLHCGESLVLCPGVARVAGKKHAAGPAGQDSCPFFPPARTLILVPHEQTLEKAELTASSSSGSSSFRPDATFASRRSEMAAVTHLPGRGGGGCGGGSQAQSSMESQAGIIHVETIGLSCALVRCSGGSHLSASLKTIVVRCSSPPCVSARNATSRVSGG